MAELLICKPGAVTEEVRAELRDAGIIVVETDDPSALRLVRSEAELDAGVLLRSALIALSRRSDDPNNRAGLNRSTFVDLLAQHAEERTK